MDCQNFTAELLEVKNLFSEAESICKKIELDIDVGGAVIPAINQLRYAGQHMLEACNSVDIEYQKIQINKAKNHCKRAIYDATEVGIFIVKQEFEEFKKKYADIVIGETVGKYSDYLECYGKLKKLVGSKKKDVVKEKHYRDLVDVYVIMNDGVINLIEHEEELKKALKKERLARDQAAQTQNNSNKMVKYSKVRIHLAYGTICLALTGLLFGKDVITNYIYPESNLSSVKNPPATIAGEVENPPATIAGEVQNE